MQRGGDEGSAEAIGDFLLGSEEIILPRSIRGRSSGSTLDHQAASRKPSLDDRDILRRPHSKKGVTWAGRISMSPEADKSSLLQGGEGGLRSKQISSSWKGEISNRRGSEELEPLSPMRRSTTWKDQPEYPAAIGEYLPMPLPPSRGAARLTSLPLGDTKDPFNLEAGLPESNLSRSPLQSRSGILSSGGIMPKPIFKPDPLKPQAWSLPPSRAGELPQTPLTGAESVGTATDLNTQLNLLRERSWTEQQSLRRQLEDQRTEKEALRKELQNAHVRAQELDIELKSLREGAAQCGDDATVLRLMEEKNAKISQLEGLLRQVAGPNSGGAAGVAQMQQEEIDRSRKELLSNKQELQALRAQREKEQNDLKELERVVAVFESKMESVKKENKELRKTVQELRQQVAEAEENRHKWSTQSVDVSAPRSAEVAANNEHMQIVVERLAKRVHDEKITLEACTVLHRAMAGWKAETHASSPANLLTLSRESSREVISRRRSVSFSDENSDRDGLSRVDEEAARRVRAEYEKERLQGEVERLEGLLKQTVSMLDVEKQQGGRMAQRLMVADDTLQVKVGEMRDLQRQCEEASRARASAERELAALRPGHEGGDGEVVQLRVQVGELQEQVERVAETKNRLAQRLGVTRHAGIERIVQLRAKTTLCGVFGVWRHSAGLAREQMELAKYLQALSEREVSRRAMHAWGGSKRGDHAQREAELEAGLRAAVADAKQARRERDEAVTLLDSAKQQLANTMPSQGTRKQAGDEMQRGSVEEACVQARRIVGALRGGMDAAAREGFSLPDGGDPTLGVQLTGDELPQVLALMADRVAAALAALVGFMSGKRGAVKGELAAAREQCWRMGAELQQAREAAAVAQETLVQVEAGREQERARLEALLASARAKAQRLEQISGHTQNTSTAREGSLQAAVSELEGQLLGMSQRVAEHKTSALRWEAEAHAASKRLALQTRALDHALASLHDNGLSQAGIQLISEASASRSDNTSSVAAGNLAAVRALESRVEEVTALWKDAARETREARAEADRWKEEKSKSEARAREEAVSAQVARSEAEAAESRAGAQAIEFAVAKGEIVALTKKMQALADAAKGEKVEVDGMKGKLEAEQNENSRLRAEMASEKAERQKEKGLAAQREHETEMARKEMQEVLAHLTAEVCACTTGVAYTIRDLEVEARRRTLDGTRAHTELTREKERLKAELNDARTQLQVASDIRSELDKKSQDMVQRCRTATADLETSRAEVNDLRWKAEQAVKDRDHAVKQYEALDRRWFEERKDSSRVLQMLCREMDETAMTLQQRIQDLESSLEKSAHKARKTMMSAEVRMQGASAQAAQRLKAAEDKFLREKEKTRAAEAHTANALKDLQQARSERDAALELHKVAQAEIREIKDVCEGERAGREAAERMAKDAESVAQHARGEASAAHAQAKHAGETLQDMLLQKTNLQAHVNTLQDKHTALESELASARDAVAGLRVEMLDMEHKLKLSAERQGAEQQTLVQKDDALRALRERVAWEQAERARVEGESLQSKAMIAQLRQDIADLHQSVNSREAALERVQGELMRARSRCGELERSLRAGDRTRERMQHAHEVAVEKMSVFKGSLEHAEKALDTWFETSRTAMGAVHMCEKALAAALSERDKMLRREGTWRGADRRVEALVEEWDSTVYMLEKQMQGLVSEMGRLGGEADLARDTVREATEKSRAQAVAIAALEQTLREVQARDVEGFNEIATLKSEIASLKASVRSSERAMGKEQERAERAEAKVRELERDRDVTGRERDSLSIRCGELERDFWRARADVEQEREARAREREASEALREKMAAELLAAQVAAEEEEAARHALEFAHDEALAALRKESEEGGAHLHREVRRLQDTLAEQRAFAEAEVEELRSKMQRRDHELSTRIADRDMRIGELESYKASGEARVRKLEQEVEEVERERERDSKQASKTLSAWRNRAEQAEAQAQKATLRASDLESQLSGKAREMAKMHGALAEAKALATAAQEHADNLERSKASLQALVGEQAQERISALYTLPEKTTKHDTSSSNQETQALRAMIKDLQNQLTELQGGKHDEWSEKARSEASTAHRSPSTVQAYVMAAQSRHEALQSRERVAEHMYRRKELVLLRECFYTLAGEACEGDQRRIGTLRLINRCVVRAGKEKASRELERSLRSEMKEIQANLVDKSNQLLASEKKFGQLLAWVQSKAAEAMQAKGKGPEAGPEAMHSKT